MCGLAGIWDFGRSTALNNLIEEANAMALALRHRGPDSLNVLSVDEGHLVLSHTRLAVVDLSAAGRQPITSSCGRLTLVYNGEIYNTVELRANLIKKGRRFRGRSDTEVLIEGFSEYGVAEFVKQINGMFAFAVYDKSSNALWLCRDRFGIKPIYFSVQDRQLRFASELSSLRCNDHGTREISQEALKKYFQNHY